MTDQPSWILLSLQLPSGPAYPRVKLWRRLREAGAVSINGGVHALPDRAEHRALFDEIAGQVRARGGQALIFFAEAPNGDSAALRTEFNRSRAAELAQWTEDAEALLARQPSASEVDRMRRRMDRLEAIDFFGACREAAARAKLKDLAIAASRHPDVRAHQPGVSYRASQLHGRVWVTRRNVGVDRIASAWLISRFIDPRPRFRFVDPQRYLKQPRELRFDMADGEFTHEDDRCSFETLLLRGDVAADKGLKALAEVIHQLDIDDRKFDRPEATNVSAALDEICARYSEDADRIRHASAVLDALHAQYMTG